MGAERHREPLFPANRVSNVTQSDAKKWRRRYMILWGANMLVRTSILSLLCLCAALGEAATAADIAAGERLARQWCANCHIVGNNTVGPVQEGPPNFATIARTGMTDSELRGFLSRPHGQMPDLSLTRSEIADLIGYIDTLK